MAHSRDDGYAYRIAGEWQHHSVEFNNEPQARDLGPWSSHEIEMPDVDPAHLVKRIVKLRPDLSVTDQLRISLLVALQNSNADEEADLEGAANEHGSQSIFELSDAREVTDAALQQQCQEISIQLAAATDQHAAVSDELDSLAATEPCDFSPEHLWTLVRAIKVQSQILNHYLGPAQTHV